MVDGLTRFQERVLWMLVLRGFTLGYANPTAGILALDRLQDGRITRVVVGSDYLLVPDHDGEWVRLEDSSPQWPDRLLKACG